VSIGAAVRLIPRNTFYVFVSAIGRLPAVGKVPSARKVLPFRLGGQAVAAGGKVAGCRVPR